MFAKNRTELRLVDDNSGAFVAPLFQNREKKDFNSFFLDERQRVRGIVTTASYEARKYGVKTAMPLAQALGFCPQLTVITPEYALYHKLSKQLRELLASQIPLIEQFSIDEFFGDLSGWVEPEESERFAWELKDLILRETGLPVSIGISPAKWIAKLATGRAKPYGVHMVRKEEISAFIKGMPVEIFPGIGRQFAKKLYDHQIFTLDQIKARKKLFYSWKKPGIQIYNRVLGIDGEGIARKTPRKSIGISRTFDGIREGEEIKRRISIMARNIVFMVRKYDVNPTVYELQLTYDYGHKAKMRKNINRIFSERLFKKILFTMYEQLHTHRNCVKIGVSVSNFSDRGLKTLSMMELEEDMKYSKLTKEVQNLRNRFGIDIIKTGNEL